MKLTHSSFLLVLALAALLLGCREKPAIKTSELSIVSSAPTERIELMSPSSGEIHRRYLSHANGVVEVEISFIDGTTGTMTAVNVGSPTQHITGAKEVLPDGSSVVYGYPPASSEPNAISYLGPNGKLTAAWTKDPGKEVVKIFREDGTLRHTHVEDLIAGRVTEFVYHPDGKTLMAEIPLPATGLCEMKYYDETGTLSYEESAELDENQAPKWSESKWYQKGVLRVKDKWVPDAGEYTALRCDLLEMFDGGGKVVLRLVPIDFGEGPGDVSRWMATQYDANGVPTSVSEVTSLLDVGFPEFEYNMAKESSLHVAEEYVDFHFDHVNHIKHFRRL